MNRSIVPGALALVLAASPALAAGTGHDAAAIGSPATAAEATRTVEVTMGDTWYEPETIEAGAGETVRFVVRNEGALVHEFSIGTAAMHAEHRDEMTMLADHGVLKPDRIDRGAAEQMHASMGHGMHDAPNALLLEPGETGEIVWTFPEGAALEFACNVPGHYEAGMQGEIRLAE